MFIWIIYRSFMCFSMAFCISAIGRYILFDTVPGIGVTLYALTWATIFFFERVIISILVQTGNID